MCGTDDALLAYRQHSPRREPEPALFCFIKPEWAMGPCVIVPPVIINFRKSQASRFDSCWMIWDWNAPPLLTLEAEVDLLSGVWRSHLTSTVFTERFFCPTEVKGASQQVPLWEDLNALLHLSPATFSTSIRISITGSAGEALQWPTSRLLCGRAVNLLGSAHTGVLQHVWKFHLFHCCCSPYFAAIMSLALQVWHFLLSKGIAINQT